MAKIFQNRTIQEWLEKYPALADVVATKPSLWVKLNKTIFEEAQAHIDLNLGDVQDASDCLERFRPYIERVFPETADVHGEIESPLVKIPAMMW